MALGRLPCLLLAWAAGWAAAETDDGEPRWEWEGCVPKQLCECKRHGVVAGVKGKDIAKKCLESGYATPDVDGLANLHTAVKENKHAFQCDSLKLNVYCYRKTGCLTETNKALCKEMAGSSCDVECDGAPARALPAAGLALPLAVVGLALARAP
mmetsp:Transcript_3270/g.9023  ORF Transcript_3270/g.9023 Transcript_3270/m.9023 type:complete len:154 (-) Transcript_3270:324-785(-)